MTLKERISADVKDAMRAKDSTRLTTLRLLTAAIKQREVDERIELGDADVLAILDRMIKQRRESIAQFEAGKREDLARAEQAEIDLLQQYMPQPLGSVEIERMIDAAIASTGAVGIAGMGKVMGVLKPQLAGRADVGAVSAKVKARLAG